MMTELRRCLNNQEPNALPVTATPTVPSAACPAGPLSQSVRGRCYEVVAVLGDDGIAARLVACGLWAGARLERLGEAPFGDPLLFRVHGFRLALRASEAVRVQVVEAAS